MAICITIALEKGGVGKTNTAVNLAALMGMDGKKVLLVDMDAQGNATYMVTGSKLSSGAFKGKGVFDLFRAYGLKDTKDFICHTRLANVDLIPTNGQTPLAIGQIATLAESEHESENLFLAYRLGEIAEDYDFIIIDTAPTRSDVLTKSSLVAADYVLMPVKCDEFSIDSLGRTCGVCKMLEEKENVEIHLLGVLLTIVEKTAFTQIIRDELRESEFGKYLFNCEIHKGQSVNESSRFAMPVVVSDKNSRPARDYMALYHEVMKRIETMEQEGEA